VTPEVTHRFKRQTPAGEQALVIGTTLKARLSETIFAQLGYDCTLQSGSGATDHALSLQLGWRF